MKHVKGVGDYAAENMLKLAGRYDGLALDSWVRGKFARMHNSARKASDKKIERYYSRFAEWRGLALWGDMTPDWLGDEQPPRHWWHNAPTSLRGRVAFATIASCPCTAG